MATTPIYALPYQVLADAPDGAALGQGEMLAVEAQLARIDAAASALAATTAAGLAAAARGYIGSTSPTSATTATTTEQIHATITANLETGRRYRIRYEGESSSTVAADVVVERFRIASGASLTTAGTLLRTTAQHTDAASHENTVSFSHIFTVASTGQYTVGIGVVRSSGTGTVKLDYVLATVEPLLTLEDMGGV